MKAYHCKHPLKKLAFRATLHWASGTSAFRIARLLHKKLCLDAAFNWVQLIKWNLRRDRRFMAFWVELKESSEATQQPLIGFPRHKEISSNYAALWSHLIQLKFKLILHSHIDAYLSGVRFHLSAIACVGSRKRTHWKEINEKPFQGFYASRRDSEWAWAAIKWLIKWNVNSSRLTVNGEVWQRRRTIYAPHTFPTSLTLVEFVLCCTISRVRQTGFLGDASADVKPRR